MSTQLAGVGLSVLFACGASAADVTEQRTWQQTYPVVGAAPQLFVRNIWGNVTVRPGPTGAMTVTVSERRVAPTRELFERTKSQLRLDIEASDTRLAMIVGGLERENDRNDACRGCRAEYQFDILVPADATIDVGTVTDGRIDVSGVRGSVNASNVNGPVAVRGLGDCARIESVNGALDVVFARAPNADCSIKTINGRITVGLPPDAGLDAVLSATQGDIESDFDVEPLTLPATVHTARDDTRFGYRLEHPAGVRIGAGGPTFTFASLNGDVRIRKNP